MPKNNGKKKQAGLVQRKKIDVVTGPTSGLGVKLIRKLLERGDEVRCVVLENPSTTGLWSRLPGGIIPYKADITLKNPDDQHHLKEVCKDADRIFHLAAITDQHNASLEEYLSTNVIGTENILKAFVEANPPEKHVQFIFMSTTAVYGSKRPGEILTEESEPKPISTYGESKLMAEQVVRSFADVHPAIQYTIFRASTMYGPYYERSFNKIFKYIKLGKLRYIGKAQNHITLVHVDDVVDGMLECAGKPEAMNQIYNLTDGESYTLKQLFDKAATFMNAPLPNKSIHPALAAIRARFFSINRAELAFIMSDRVVSIAKIKKELGFSPHRNIDNEGNEMVQEFLKRYRE